MDFDQLTTFMEVAKLGSFSRAGQKVFRSQSAVSAQIRQLEQEYGDRLLDRSGKDVTLTPAGRVLFAYAERLLQMRDESLLAVADQGTSRAARWSSAPMKPPVFMCCPTSSRNIAILYPGVQISIYRNFSYKIVEKLENGTHRRGHRDPAGEISQPEDARYLSRSADADGEPAERHWPSSMWFRLRDVAKQPLLLPKTGYSRRVMDKLFRPYASHLQIRMELPSVGMIKSFVAAGLGVSLISSSFAKDQVLAGRVKLIPIQDQELWRELGHCLPARPHPTPAPPPPSSARCGS